MRVIHLWPHTQNVGDYFVQKGIRQLLTKHVGPHDYSGLPCNRHGGASTQPRGITAASLPILQTSDLVVIGGSNLYEFVGEDWGVQVEDAALATLNVPVLLLGIGSGWTYKNSRVPAATMKPKGTKQIRALHERALGSSVRDHMTARALAAHGIEATVTGCPACYIASNDLQPLRKGVVGVAMLPERMHAAWAPDPRRWRNAKYRRQRKITTIFKEVLDGIHARGYQTRLLVHDVRDVELSRTFPATTRVESSDPDKMLAAIAECDVIIGFRLHACIAALGMGIPCIPFLADGRSYGFSETFGLAEVSVAPEELGWELVLNRVELALGSGRAYWAPAIARRRELERTMHEFMRSSLAGAAG